MKTQHIKTLALCLACCFSLRTGAQSDSRASINRPASFSTDTEQIMIGDIKQDPVNYCQFVNITCKEPVVMTVRIFSMNGELVKDMACMLQEGSNKYTLHVNELSIGNYIVQFYTNAGSAIRRLHREQGQPFI